MRYQGRILSGVFLLLLSSAAFAHPGHEPGGSLAAGLLHPLTGLDHLLAMLAVGMYAAQCGGRAFWAVPGAFVLFVAAGALAAVTGIQLPLAELGIAGSVIVFGLLLSFGSQLALPLAAGLVLSAGFALFHGFAHGVEAPVGAGLGYGLGFLAMTALLHAAGIGLVMLLRSAAAMRLAGGAIAVIGGILLMAA
jgi:urease accessory protein